VGQKLQKTAAEIKRTPVKTKRRKEVGRSSASKRGWGGDSQEKGTNGVWRKIGEKGEAGCQGEGKGGKGIEAL